MIIWRFIKWRFGLSKAEAVHGPYVPQYAEPDLAAIHSPDPGSIQVTWVGHSTFLVQLAGMNILTDPIWSERASFLSWAGPKRQSRPGIRFEDLPRIDVVLISHTHYDHLDRPTILRLGNTPRYFIPTNTKAWFAQVGAKKATELEWWQGTDAGTVKISSVPAEHWSRRKVFGKEKAGWGGYVIESSVGNVYFAGDTGFHSQYFKDIGKRFEKIDVGLIPIGAYYPREIFGRYHIDPREAIIVHQEVGAKRSVGMHWGTFMLTQEPLDEPPKELARQREAEGIAPEEFSVLKIGETRSL